MADGAVRTVAGGVADDALQLARESLFGRRAFRWALLGLFALGTLAVFAPFLASERPLYLAAVHRGEFERARRTLVPVAQSLAGLLARSEAEYQATRAAGAQDLAAARASEGEALEVRLATLAQALEAGAKASVSRCRDELARVLERAASPRAAEAAPAGAELVEHVRALAAELEPARVTLRAQRSWPLLEGLTPLEAGLAAGWLLLCCAPLLARRLGALRLLASAVLLALAVALAWRAALGSGRAFPSASFKADIASGDLAVERVVFPPLPYGFAEQHVEESLRPPTWLAAAELDLLGAYVRGPRAPKPDPVTGFLPSTRPIEVLPGEPALNSPWRHVLGTDTTGRDLLARILHGGRVSLAVGALAALLMLGIGVAVGAVAGYCGGRIDRVLSRVIEIVLSFPLLFLVLVTIAFVGPSLAHVILVLGALGWTGVARLTRSEFLRQRELDYVAAARSLGYSHLRIALRHILPNTVSPLFVAATFSVAGAILVEAALSFLGFGVRVPTASWGALASETREPDNWWLLVFPGLFLLATVLCLQLIGDALRDAQDPRTVPVRGRAERQAFGRPA